MSSSLRLLKSLVFLLFSTLPVFIFITRASYALNEYGYYVSETWSSLILASLFVAGSLSIAFRNARTGFRIGGFLLAIGTLVGLLSLF